MRLWYQFMRDPEDIASVFQTNENEIDGEVSFIDNSNHEIVRSLLETNNEPNQLDVSLNASEIDI